MPRLAFRSDPVLRMWASLVLREPMPKDFLVTKAFSELNEAQDSASLLNVLQKLLELAQDGIEHFGTNPAL